jgi:hypothetical protein
MLAFVLTNFQRFCVASIYRESWDLFLQMPLRRVSVSFGSRTTQLNIMAPAKKTRFAFAQ